MKTTLTPEEKAKRRAEKLKRWRKSLIRQMEKDVAVLRKIIRGPKKPE